MRKTQGVDIMSEKTTYIHKLVRDGIPEQIAKTGQAVTYRALEGDELLKALHDKLIEEANELIDAKDVKDMLEEAGDVISVVEAIVNYYKIDIGDMVHRKNLKRIDKGDFSSGYFLETIRTEVQE